MNLIARSRLTTASLLARFRANVGGNVAIVFAFSVITITVALGPCLPPPEDDTAAVLGRIEAWFRCAAQGSERAVARAAVSARP